MFTALDRDEEWHQARDAYHAHWFACKTCKPSAICADGLQLRTAYEAACKRLTFSEIEAKQKEAMQRILPGRAQKRSESNTSRLKELRSNWSI